MLKYEENNNYSDDKMDKVKIKVLSREDAIKRLRVSMPLVPSEKIRILSAQERTDGKNGGETNEVICFSVKD